MCRTGASKVCSLLVRKAVCRHVLVADGETMNVVLPDGKMLDVAQGATPADVAARLGPGLAKAALAARVNGVLCDLATPVHDGDTVALVTFDSADGKSVFWHTSSHIMAQAVQELFPQARLAIGPAIESGFYYDFDVPTPFTPQDIAAVEKRCAEIVARREPVRRETVSREQARTLFESKGESYKVELIADLEGEPTLYHQGEWVDLCRGPHLPHTGYVRAFKILSNAGAYWRGDERNRMLQRLYAVSFPRQALLQEHLTMLEEAQRRDHRRLGRELGLYSTSEQVGPGLILWDPKGGRLRTVVEDFWRTQHYANGYELVYSPHVGRGVLWETSGHLDFYRENMYASMDVDGQEYFVKPMNCPFHIMMYKNRQWSYRDLPLRWAELGTVYRYEKSGVLHGLLRVRGFTQDDAHLICLPGQMPGEIRKVLRFCLHMLRSFGFDTFKVYLATRPEGKSVGDQASWDAATAALDAAVRDEGLECDVDEGGGAFYGPKIDIKIRDALNREWQCSTIQFDFNLPQRFDLVYIDADGNRQRPVMIHRALLGSLERFMGILIEHYAGALPLWLAPEQVRVLPVSDRTLQYARTVNEQLCTAGLRSKVDERAETVGFKIREAEVDKIPWMLIVGEKEQAAGTVSLRRHGGGGQDSCAREEAVSRLVALHTSRTIS